jgi:hypothetical protein
MLLLLCQRPRYTPFALPSMKSTSTVLIRVDLQSTSKGNKPFALPLNEMLGDTFWFLHGIPLESEWNNFIQTKEET